ncbi:hypothetical protein D3C71_746860 [compost metagenome]
MSLLPIMKTRLHQRQQMVNLHKFMLIMVDTIHCIIGTLSIIVTRLMKSIPYFSIYSMRFGPWKNKQMQLYKPVHQMINLKDLLDLMAIFPKEEDYCAVDSEKKEDYLLQSLELTIT